MRFLRMNCMGKTFAGVGALRFLWKVRLAMQITLRKGAIAGGFS